MNRIAVRESEIPLDALYNQHVNAIKLNEKNFHLKTKPLTLNVWKNYTGVEGENLTRIIRQDGGKEAFD